MTRPAMQMMTVLLVAFILFGSTVRLFGQDGAAPAKAQAGAPAVDAPATARSAEAEAALEKYTQLRAEWKKVVQQIEQVQTNAGSDAGASTEQQLVELYQKADRMLGEIITAALKVHAADPHGYPKINGMLTALAQFFVVGDYSGDGGDQFEKALPIAQALIDAGEAAENPELWLWGGVSAFATNEYALARKYFAEAEKAGVLGDMPPSQHRDDPRTRAWMLAKQFVELVDTYEGAWKEEQKIREAEAKADDLPRVVLHTAKGDIVIELFENEAPQAVANFITLVKSGFYDGLSFHRVLPGFMAQGGCPDGTGGGGPGYCIRCECYQPNARKHFRGSLSMAHAGRDTGGSQFFLTFVPTTYLNGKHTVFGRVIEGMDVASAIARRDPESYDPGPADTILKAEVLRDRGHAYKFDKLPAR